MKDLKLIYGCSCQGLTLDCNIYLCAKLWANWRLGRWCKIGQPLWCLLHCVYLCCCCDIWPWLSHSRDLWHSVLKDWSGEIYESEASGSRAGVCLAYQYACNLQTKFFHTLSPPPPPFNIIMRKLLTVTKSMLGATFAMTFSWCVYFSLSVRILKRSARLNSYTCLFVFIGPLLLPDKY